MITAKCLIGARFAQTSNIMEYTAVGRTIIDKLTLTNTDATARTVSINIVPSGQSTGTFNTILSNVSIPANQTYVATEMTNQILNAGDFVTVKASQASTVVIRMSGREIT